MTNTEMLYKLETAAQVVDRYNVLLMVLLDKVPKLPPTEEVRELWNEITKCTSDLDDIINVQVDNTPDHTDITQHEADIKVQEVLS